MDAERTPQSNPARRRGPGRQRSPAVRDAQTRRAVELTTAGLPQRAIAETLGVAPSTVNADLRAERRRWAEETIGDLTAALGDELARLDAVEAAAWSAWRKGQAATIPSVKPLEVLVRVSRQRSNLLGLQPPGRLLVQQDVRVRDDTDLAARLDRYRHMWEAEAIDADTPALPDGADAS